MGRMSATIPGSRPPSGSLLTALGRSIQDRYAKRVRVRGSPRTTPGNKLGPRERLLSRLAETARHERAAYLRERFNRAFDYWRARGDLGPLTQMRSDLMEHPLLREVLDPADLDALVRRFANARYDQRRRRYKPRVR